jgi:hypothetical protein
MGIEEVLKDAGSFVAGAALVALPVFSKWAKNRFEKVNFTGKKLDIAQLVSERLTEIRAEHHIDRLSILEFSNGDKSVSGFPFLFVTMTYEKCAQNIAGIKHLINKVPSSWYVEFNYHFTDKSVMYGYFFDDGRCKIGDGPEFMCEETAKLLLGFGVKSTWTFKLGHNISTGLLNIGFTDEYKIFTPAEIMQICGDSRYIDHLFNQRPQ